MTKKILFIDDERYATYSYQCELELAGFEVLIADDATKAKRLIEMHNDADAIILDIMMPPGEESEFHTKGGFESGLIVAQWVKKNYPSLPIIALTNVTSSEVEDWFKKHGSTFIRKEDVLPCELVEIIQNIVSGSSRISRLKTFIVHGHDETAKYQLKNYLQNTLKLSEPIILHEQPSLGRTIIEKFEEVTQNVDLVFVLLTPDDILSDLTMPNDVKRRARQNVIFEMGYFFGKLKRRKGRVFLLHKGGLDMPTDIAGIIYIDITNGIDSAGELIRKEIEAVLGGT